MSHLRRRSLLLALLLAASACSGEKQKDQRAPNAEDAESLARLVDTAAQLRAQITANAALLDRESASPLTREERATLLSIWAPLIDLDLAFASYRERFLRDWRSAKGETGPVYALSLGMAAVSAQTLLRLELLARLRDGEVLHAALNDASPDYGVAAGHLDAMLLRLAQPSTLLLLDRGTGLLEQWTLEMRKKKKKEDQRYNELVGEALEASRAALALYDSHAVRLMTRATRVVAANQLDAVVDPLVQNIAEWLGDTRLRQSEASLISAEQVDALQARLDPGDVLLERRNWYLSNLGLPGFWPHSELYVGTEAELAEYFDSDPEVREAYPDGLGAFIARQSPEAWAAFRKAGADGRPHRILEAISEGVAFSSLHEAAQADYVAAVRPRLTRLAKADALTRAFTHFAKPYDFDFDFLTLSTLVCSELVFQAYLAPPGEGLELPLSEVIGRLTLPPNDLARMFDEQFGTGAQQLDFVAFLDGREALQGAVDADVEAFRASWKRPKWDLSQQ